MRPSRIIKPGKRIGHLHVLSHILDGSGQWVEMIYSKSDLQEIRRIIGKAIKDNQ